jgi:catechol 2,3-dioxygenase-like lactoylglutathione lyase family enzyme
MGYRLHHVHLICRDLKKMIAFFEDVIGAKFVEHRKFGNADGAMLDLQGITINLRVSREDEEIGENISRSNYGFDHIGLLVEDLEAARENLTQRGYSFFVPPTETADYIIAFFKGPENISIELLQPLEQK